MECPTCGKSDYKARPLPVYRVRKVRNARSKIYARYGWMYLIPGCSFSLGTHVLVKYIEVRYDDYGNQAIKLIPH